MKSAYRQPRDLGIVGGDMKPPTMPEYKCPKCDSNDTSRGYRLGTRRCNDCGHVADEFWFTPGTSAKVFSWESYLKEQ